jgi:hypothetical protein
MQHYLEKKKKIENNAAGGPTSPLLYIVGKTGEAVETIDLLFKEVGSNCD